MKNKKTDEFRALAQLQVITGILFVYLGIGAAVAWGLEVSVNSPRWLGVIIFILGFSLGMKKIYDVTNEHDRS